MYHPSNVQIFPFISTYDQFTTAVGEKDEIKTGTNDLGYKTVSYVVSLPTTFDTPYARECRGIVFNPDGMVVARPLHKFFNLNERDGARPEDFDWSKLMRVMDKRDGCLDGQTVLLTPDGLMTIKDICDTKYRGLVLGFEDGNVIATPVLGHLIQNDDKKVWYELTCENGAILRLTGNHEIFSTTRNKYVRIDELMLDDEVLELGGAFMKITSIKKIANNSLQYDVQTGTANFFANEVLVHNSMIHTVIVADSPFNSLEMTFDVKSKKSFSSDVANSARKLLKDLPKYLAFCQDCAINDLTAIFEYTSPTARIVLPYPTEELTLLHIRDNQTGRYVSHGELTVRASQFGIPIVANNTAAGTDELFTEMLAGDRDPKQIWRAVQKLAETVEGIEGWIFQFETGEMVKVKTKWYIERHRAMTNLRERDLHLECLRETVDDLKAMLVQEGVDITEIEGIETTVGEYLKGMLHSIYAKLEENKHLDRKSFAMKVGPAGEDFEYFGLLMKAYEGKEPDVKGHYERHVLPTVSLRQLNLTQSVAEAE